jgi:hypothetical protein
VNVPDRRHHGVYVLMFQFACSEALDPLAPNAVNGSNEARTPTLRFQSKVVIVTGAASGIAEATAKRFSSEGACVALVDCNEIALANVAVDLPRELTLALVADVSDSEAVEAVVETVVKRFRRLDIMTRTGMTADMMDDDELLAKFAERILLGRVCEPLVPRQ